MTNPTSNFNWIMPEPTSLVTDLPADFEVFGQAVDTDFQDLLGGTTGQVLSKTSATDLAFTWVDANPGDITGVTAGTGISGGGTSGTVTVTNSMATAITTAGDLIKGTGSGTFDRLGIGSDGQVLTVTAGAPAWETPAAGGSTFSGVVVSLSANVSTTNAAGTIINFDTERIDTDAYHSTATNTSRLTVPVGKAGKFALGCSAVFANNATGYRNISFRKNGASYFNNISAANVGASGNAGVMVTMVYELLEGDYFEIDAYQNSGGSLNLLSGNGGTYFYMYYLGA
jgi:hypothetical protein